MFSVLLPLACALLIQQQPAPSQPQGPLDAPVFTDSASGVALARPFDDWVFEPDHSRGTTRVTIFHPSAGSLGDMFWGALAITSFRRSPNLGQLSRQRVSATWQPTLGATFQLLERDSLTIAGYPAIHLVMSGAINQAVLEVEEYLIARGSDFVALQFRYPRALPHDSIARGYRRSLASLRLSPPADTAAEAAPPADEAAAAPVQAAPLAPAPPAGVADSEDFVPPPWQQMWSLLDGSPWHIERVDASVRLDDRDAPPVFVVRLDVVNDGPAPADIVPLWLPLGASVDSVQLGRAGERVYAGSSLGGNVALQLPDTITFQGHLVLTAYYRRGPIGGAGAFVDDWLPAVESPWDSLGRGRGTTIPRITCRFDVPDGLAAIATGRLTADVRGSGRRMETWQAEGVAAAAPGFVVGPFHASSGMAGRLAVNAWGAGVDLSIQDSAAHLVADAWAFGARAFGLVGPPEVTIVVGAPVTRGLPGLVLLTAAAAGDPATVRRETARTWWGGAVRGAGPGTAWIDEAFPALAARLQDTLGAGAPVWRSARTPPLATIVPRNLGDIRVLRAAGAAALLALRQAIGEARFREALRSFAANHRGGSASADDFLATLPATGNYALRPYLYGN